MAEPPSSSAYSDPTHQDFFDAVDTATSELGPIVRRSPRQWDLLPVGIVATAITCKRRALGLPQTDASGKPLYVQLLTEDLPKHQPRIPLHCEQVNAKIDDMLALINKLNAVLSAETAPRTSRGGTTDYMDEEASGELGERKRRRETEEGGGGLIAFRGEHDGFSPIADYRGRKTFRPCDEGSSSLDSRSPSPGPRPGPRFLPAAGEGPSTREFRARGGPPHPSTLPSSNGGGGGGTAGLGSGGFGGGPYPPPSSHRGDQFLGLGAAAFSQQAQKADVFEEYRRHRSSRYHKAIANAFQLKMSAMHGGSGPSDEKLCYICHQPGHFAKHCKFGIS